MSEYATSNFAEDKGDIGAAIQGRQFSYLNEICAVDPIVAAKVRLTIDEMNRFCVFGPIRERKTQPGNGDSPRFNVINRIRSQKRNDIRHHQTTPLRIGLLFPNQITVFKFSFENGSVRVP